MEDVINQLGSGSSWIYWLNRLPHLFDVFGLPSTAFSISVIFAGAGLAILNRFTGNVGYITLPINYLGLLIGALVANSLMRDLRTPFEPTLQAPIIFAIAGMTISGLVMMLILKKQ